MSQFRARFLYGTGGAVYAVKESAYTMFILLFYTQVLGLSGWVTGIIIGISLLWDGVSDPLVGVLSDRLQSRWGRRFPFMVASIIPAGLGFVGLFSPPESVQGSATLLASWLLFWSLWVRTFVTGFSIPHLALSAEITSDYNERSQILGARMAFMFLFAVLLPALALSIIFTSNEGVDGRFVAQRYPLYGALSCAIVWLMATIACLGSRRYARPAASISAPAHTLHLRRDLRRTLQNPTFRLLMGFELAAAVSYGTVVTLNMLAWTYFWEFSAADIAIILAIPSVLAIALVMLTLGPLGRRFHKNQLLRFSVLAIVADMLWLYPLRLLDLLPPNGSDTVLWLNFIFMLVFMYCFLLRSISSSSIIADIADEHELEHGVRQEAGFFSITSLLQKVASVTGPLYSGAVLDVIGLSETMLPGEIPQVVLNNLVHAMGLGAIPALLLGYYFARKIQMDGTRVATIQRQLSESRVQASALAAEREPG